VRDRPNFSTLQVCDQVTDQVYDQVADLVVDLVCDLDSVMEFGLKLTVRS